MGFLQSLPFFRVACSSPLKGSKCSVKLNHCQMLYSCIFTGRAERQFYRVDLENKKKKKENISA